MSTIGTNLANQPPSQAVKKHFGGKRRVLRLLENQLLYKIIDLGFSRMVGQNERPIVNGVNGIAALLVDLSFSHISLCWVFAQVGLEALKKWQEQVLSAALYSWSQQGLTRLTWH